MEFSVCKLDPYPNLNVQKYMHDEAALNLMETVLYSKPRRCFFPVFRVFLSGGITAKLCYFLFVDDGLSRSFLTIFPPPQSSEGNIDVKKKIRSGVSLKEEDLAGITGWIGWVFLKFFILRRVVGLCRPSNLMMYSFFRVYTIEIFR